MSRVQTRARAMAAPRQTRAGAGLRGVQATLDWGGDDGLVAGVDEAGRGPLAGPVVAAAVILDPSVPIEGVADSKALTAPQLSLIHI